MLALVVLLGGVGLGYLFLTRLEAGSLLSTESDALPLTATVQRTSLPIIISAGGELASSESVDVACELEGQHKITEMLPEGTLVEEGQVVLRLDPSEINNLLAAQKIKVTRSNAVAKAAVEELKIQRNLADSLVATAELAQRLAELDEEKYLKGDYSVLFNDLQGLIALAKTDLQDAQAEREHFADLVKKGFRTPEQLRSKEQAVKRAEYNLSRDEERLRVLQTYERKRQTVELEAKAREAQREVARAKSSAAASIVKVQTDLEVSEATAALELQQLARIENQLELCSIRAVSDGVLVYAKEKNKVIEPGATVHYKQHLFGIPKSRRMQVNAFVHESVVQRVRPGISAEIRVEAFPNLVMQGSVKNIASFYDSTRHWLSGGVKEYATTITIDGAVSDVLRSGMTAEVQILAGEITDSLVVPITAVAQRDDRHYCFLMVEDAILPQVIEVGLNTEDHVVIRNGLKEGDRVALDARRRLSSNLDLQPNEPTSVTAEIAAR